MTQYLDLLALDAPRKPKAAPTQRLTKKQALERFFLLQRTEITKLLNDAHPLLPMLRQAEIDYRLKWTLSRVKGEKTSEMRQYGAKLLGALLEDLGISKSQFKIIISKRININE